MTYRTGRVFFGVVLILFGVLGMPVVGDVIVPQLGLVVFATYFFGGTIRLGDFKLLGFDAVCSGVCLKIIIQIS